MIRYRAQDSAGRELKGVLELDNEAQAVRELKRQGLRPLSVALDAPPAVPPMPSRGGRAGRIGVQDRATLMQELGTLLRAGVVLDEALASLAAGYTGTPLAPVLSRALAAVRAGASLSQALAGTTLGLPPAVSTLVRVGEASGQIAEALLDGAEQLAQAHKLRQELRNALTYPAVLVGAGTLAVLIIFMGVLPRFAPLLRSARGEVPAFSVWTIETAVFLKANALAVGLGVAALLAVLVAVLGRPSVRARLMDALAGTRLLGPWLRELEVGRWATLMGAMLRNRVPLLEALQLSQQGSELSGFRSALVTAARDLQQGKTLHAGLAQSGWIAPARLNLIRVGERTGSLDAMLASLGGLQLDAARQRQKTALALIEPLAILLIGAVIGVLMVAVMMAITSLNAGAG